MIIISWNVNGLRAVDKKGELIKLINRESPDILLLQEVKAQESQLMKIKNDYFDYEHFYNSAVKPGYSGTAILIKKSTFKHAEFSTGMDHYQDDEGRVATLFIGNLAIISVYVPNGGKSSQAWNDKLVFYELLLKYINKLRSQGKNVIIAGDFNCAHQEIDLARPKENENSIGFLPEERVWLDKYHTNHWLDIFRFLHPDQVAYSWWHVITRARERNIGWRIDYFFIDQSYSVNVFKVNYLEKQMGSDHCPMLLSIDF